MTPATCKHDTLHSITSEYDRRNAILTYYRTCEGCGVRLEDVERVDYRPDFDPAGNDPYRAAA